MDHSSELMLCLAQMKHRYFVPECCKQRAGTRLVQAIKTFQARSLKKSLGWPSFFQNLNFQQEQRRPTEKLLSCTITIITIHLPGQNMLSSLGPGPFSKCSKQWKSDVDVRARSSLNSVRARSSLRKLQRACSAIHPSIIPY